MTKKLDLYHLSVLTFFTVLCLLTDASATIINRTMKGGVSGTPWTNGKTYTPQMPLFPITTILAATPTFGTTGIAYAYEEEDKFDRGPEPKINYSLTFPEEKSTQDEAFAEGRYGDHFMIHDWARTQATFTGTPQGFDVSVGPTNALVMTSISAKMELDLQTHEEGGIEDTLSEATITDPFEFSGVTDDVALGFTAIVHAGMSFTFDSEGAAAGGEIRRTFIGSTDISSMENLFTLTIAVGMTDFGVADMVVDFSSNGALGLDDFTITQTLLDNFDFDIASNTFTLESDVTLYNDVVPFPDGTTDFTLAFSDHGIIDSYMKLYSHTRGGAGSTSITQVPEPPVLLLMLIPVVFLMHRHNPLLLRQ